MLVLSLLMANIAFSQITVRFASRLALNGYIQMDSVVVENVTRSWTERLVYPDTVLVFASSSIAEAQGWNIGLASYPNPFRGTATVSLTAPESGNYTLRLFNLSGQLLAETAQRLEAGTSLFDISLREPQMALLTVSSAHGQKSLKLLNSGRTSGNAIAFRSNIMATNKMQSNQPFATGDLMRYIGYATYNGNQLISTPIEQNQQVSESLTLLFSADLPTVYTNTPTNVSTTTASCGGNVLSDGGSPIISRGICWSISQNPTTNDSHTSDSTGLGTFSSNITGLTSGTFYFVRAYATNTNGTAYGNETFVLATPENYINPLPGVFSISATDQIHFSKGNLQYTNLGTHVVAGGDTVRGTWRFAEHQWETIGTANSNISSTYTGWIDLFCWATSGYHDSNDIYNTHYYPYSYDTNSVSRQYNWWGYGPSLNMPDTNLVGTSANYDWGVYNAISNGGNRSGVWRTLSYEECEYLIRYRTDAGQKWGLGYLNGVYGAFLLPDDWTLPQGLTFSPGRDSNSYTVAEWAMMESLGAVFLPSGLNRYHTNVGGAAAYYWTSSNCYVQGQNSNLSSHYFVCPAGYGYMTYGGCRRCFGGSVRLVTNSK